MKYLFILGRNVELSKAEVFAYLRRTGNKALSHSLDKNGLLVEVVNPLKERAVDFLGGIIGIGEVIDFRNSLYNGKKNNFNYLIWDFSNKTEDIAEEIKKRFKSEKLKASRKHFTKSMKMQNGEEAFLPTSNLINEEYFVFGDFFGRIIQKTNYKSLEERDMGKPVRREELSISPRLAKIMINLSEVPTNGKIVDAFCGVGVILFEGLLQDLEVVGVDKDSKAIDGALRNLVWGNFNRQKYYLLKDDSRKVKIPKVDAMVSEPDLGEILRKLPTKDKAIKILRDYEMLMVSVINNLKNKISGRIVFTAPLIKTSRQRISCNIDAISIKTKTKLLNSFEEFRENQIVGRSIFVLSSD